MKVTYDTLQKSRPALRVLANERVGIAVSMRLARFLTKIEDEMRPFDQKHQELLDLFGKPTGKQGVYEIPDDAMAEFSKNMDEMGSEEIEIDLPSVSISELDGAQLTPAQMTALIWIFPG